MSAESTPAGAKWGRSRAAARARFASERGTTMVETAIALGILLVVLAGLLSMAAFATSLTENQGHLAARTTEYAQDKMEQLLALAYNDAQTDTSANSLIPPATGGTGLAIGGSTNPAAPVNLYVDWLDADGGLLGGGTSPPTTWFYERVWQITCSVGTCTGAPLTGIKQITVTASVRTSVARAIIPRSSVTALKTAPF
jgi:hypothetical protein